MSAALRPRRALVALLLVTGCSAVGAASACPGLEVREAWIREAPPGVPVLAGYARLHNNAPAPLRITGLRAKDFGAVEIHETRVIDGQSGMRRHAELRLDAGATAVLEPGGLHLMLFRPQRPLVAGETASLQFDCGSSTTAIPFPVKRSP